MSSLPRPSSMSIGLLAEQSGVSTDTLRFYEHQGLLDTPARGANGYRRYGPEALARVRFVRGAQALGFSLAEIRSIVGRLAAGLVGRADLERALQVKIDDVDAHIRRLRDLKRALRAAAGMLDCVPADAVPIASATPKARNPRTPAARASPKRRSPGASRHPPFAGGQ
ncbi:MerR family transcriptional regulator [Aquabacterium humicola]|uniref:MerR family transcriptional regulator n=1 Tax=Aquabacterium humicola TaxID=3237377 RepID=UPI0025438512|nr:MerR family transcriptional regulator [Rubrivivax pictus]